MWPNPQETADLLTFTKEIFNGKLIFCEVQPPAFAWLYKASYDCISFNSIF